MWVGVFFAVIVIPNIITCASFVAMSQFFRGWLNVEFVLLAALYVATRSRFALGLIALELVCDLFEPVARLYYFTPTDALGAVKYLGNLPLITLATYSGYVLAYLAIVTGSVYLLLSKAKAPNRPLSLTLILVSVLALGSDVCRGRYISEHADAIAGRPHLVRVPAGTLSYALVQRTRMALHWSRARRDVPVQSAAGQTLAQYGPSIFKSRTNVVLVLLESWGELLDAGSASQMLQAYQTPVIASRYRIETGSVPFFGSTIEGATRELCGHTFSHGLAEASVDELRTCLPSILQSHGYQTIGIHGFEPGMYGRDHWYPRIGLQTHLFRPDLAAMGMKTCPGGLIGTCDSDISDFIGRRLLQAGPAKPVLIHWTSLNSHLPVDRNGPESNHCQAGGREEETLCIWSRLVQNVHRGVAQIASQDQLSPTVFIVVGDHAPPFGSQYLRGRFSQEKVPFLVLVPRELQKAANDTPVRPIPYSASATHRKPKVAARS